MIIVDKKLKSMFPGCFVGPASVDLTLSNSFMVPKNKGMSVSLREDTSDFYSEVEADKIILEPGEFLLASTNEVIDLPSDVAAYVEGRSSLGRLGVQIQNAGFIDPGFKGEITLEIYNQGSHNILLERNIRICQLVAIRCEEKCSKPYAGKYLDQKGATSSRIWKDFIAEPHTEN